MTDTPDDKAPLEELIKDPSAHFENPGEVLKHATLEKPEKIAILQSWKVDEEEKSIATSENMGSTDSNRLSEVVNALQRLENG